MTAKYDLKLKENELKELAEKQKTSRQLQITLAVILILVLIVSFTLILNLNLIKKNRIQNLKLIEQENWQLKTELELKEKDFQYKSKELSKAISSSITINDALNKLKKLLADQRYTEAINLINSHFSSKMKWEQFLSTFNELYPHFLKRLNQFRPELTTREIQLCVFLVMEMKTTEIAAFLNISNAAVSKGRNRLRKKLNLKTGADISEFLKKFI
jgi:DNA-binding NarL/FixJ family response regulator